MSIDAMKLALEAAEVLEKLFRQAEAMHKGSLPSMNLDCQITTEDLRKGLYAAATLRTAIEQAEKQEPVTWNSGVPPLYPEMKDGETISVEYLETTPQPQRERVIFPTMLRKMWSGGEVQAWLDENVNKEKSK